MIADPIVVQHTKSHVRTWVIGAMVAGIVATVAGAGTFASFSASTSNPGNVFSTGRLELSNTKQGGNACISGHTGVGGAAQATLDSNGNSGCDALIDLTVQSPGDTASGQLALANTGDYDGLLQFWLDGCTTSTVVTPAGSGNLCNKLEVYIQEFTSGAYTTATSACVFPFNAGASCSPTWGGTGDTIADLATAAQATSPMPSAPITLNKTGVKYFQISLQFPNGGFDSNGNGSDNAFQNRRASFDLSWRLQEA